MGRPPKEKNEVQDASQEDQKPSPPEAPAVNPKLAVKEEFKDGLCPWCNETNVKNKQIRTRHSWQCLTCGKDWEEASLGQKWSIGVERGKAWTKENAKRELNNA